MPGAHNKAIRVLLVQHYRSEAVGFRGLLARAGCVALEEADCFSTALQCLVKGGIRIILLDWRLLDVDGVDALKILRSRFPDIPVIVLTDLDNKHIAPTVMQMGAKDCIVTDYIDSHLLGQIILRHAAER